MGSFGMGVGQEPWPVLGAIPRTWIGCGGEVEPAEKGRWACADGVKLRSNWGLYLLRENKVRLIMQNNNNIKFKSQVLNYNNICKSPS